MSFAGAAADERLGLLRGARPQAAVRGLAHPEPRHHQHGRQAHSRCSPNFSSTHTNATCLTIFPCYSLRIRRHLLCGQAAAGGQGDAGGEFQEAGADHRLEDEAGGQDRAGPGGARGTGQELALIGTSSPSSKISIILDR